MFFSPEFFGEGGPQILDLVFKITPISDHVAVSRRSAERPQRSRAEEKKKETAAKRKGLRVALSQWAALITTIHSMQYNFLGSTYSVLGGMMPRSLSTWRSYRCQQQVRWEITRSPARRYQWFSVISSQ